MSESGLAHRDSIRAVAKDLCEGEKVRVGTVDQERTLTVEEPAEYVEMQYRFVGHRVKFSGYGTEYRLEIPREQDNRPPVLVWPSSDALGTIVNYLDPEREIGLVAEKTAADMGIPER